MSINLSWFYNERHHGKGPMEKTGDTLKNAVSYYVKSEKAIINDAKEFAECVDKTIKGISSLYMSSDDVIVEQDEMKAAPKIPETLKIYKFVRSMKKEKSFASILLPSF